MWKIFLKLEIRSRILKIVGFVLSGGQRLSAEIEDVPGQEGSHAHNKQLSSNPKINESIKVEVDYLMGWSVYIVHV